MSNELENPIDSTLAPITPTTASSNIISGAAASSVQPESVSVNQGAASDSSTAQITPNQNPITGTVPPVSGLPSVYGPSVGGTLNANFGNVSVGAVNAINQAANAVSGNLGAQGGPSQQDPPPLDLLPSGGLPLSASQGNNLGDFPEQSGPEATAGSQDPASPDGTDSAGGQPVDPNGPTAVAFNPEGDYGGGGLPGVRGPGVASFNPEGDAGNSSTANLPGFEDPGVSAGLPNPEGTGPVGPAALGADLETGPSRVLNGNPNR